MSKVQEYMKCPQCGGVYNHVVELGSGEQTDTCMRCGKRYRKKSMLDKNGVPLRSERGDLLYHTEEMFGYGVVGIGHISGIVHIYQLDEPYNEILERIFQKILRQDSVDQNLSYLTRWDVIQNDVVAVYGNLPEIFEDFIKSN